MRIVLAAILCLCLGFTCGWGYQRRSKKAFRVGPDLLDSVRRANMTTLTDVATTPFNTQWRPAIIRKTVDGDTQDIELDCGFSIFTKIRVRLVHLAALEDPRIGIDTWELHGSEREKGFKAKARVEALLPPGTEIRVASRKGGSQEALGRWLCCLLYKQGDGWVSLGDTLLSEGHAKEWWSGVDKGAPRPGAR